ncbi:RNA polymerase sigma factor [Leptospira santarosai]|uniref:RNA polymerase sigma factor n=1 Tax=Leptospira santarosai TaxID=28183 RepID=UPI001E33388A|nr:RNA polymerase sigma factor [Leptospira santarosai]
MNNSLDLKFIRRAIEGDRLALEKLLERHQGWIYNFCRSMMLNPLDAEDATQEVLIKIALNLSKYDERIASFPTWVKKITTNHVLNMKKKKMEEVIENFEWYGNGLDSVPFQEMSSEERSQPETRLLIEESKVGCIMGMLLCLNKEQRIVLILGEIMGLPDRIGAEILDITKVSFRQKLARARRDLYNFMDQKCGLINQNNPCRCHRKTKGFIEAGWVNPKQIQFSGTRLKKIKEAAPGKSKIFDEFCQAGYTDLLRMNPYFETPKELLSKVLNSLEIV